jgi:endonuclease-3
VATSRAALSTKARKKNPKATAPSPQSKATATRQESAVAAARGLRITYRKLVETHPDAHCELNFRSPFELIVATALSAQSTDVQVNKVTPVLFKRFPTPEKLGAAKQEDVEQCIGSLGMFRQKSKNLIGLARGLLENYHGEVPADLDSLVTLPGVGRKTANVVLGVAFDNPVGVVVDTHVQRISQRLGWTKNTTPEKIEQDLMSALPRSEWDRVSHTLIFHGRRVCTARKPACSTCSVSRRCPAAFNAEHVGRKPPKPGR